MEFTRSNPVCTLGQNRKLGLTCYNLFLTIYSSRQCVWQWWITTSMSLKCFSPISVAHISRLKIVICQMISFSRVIKLSFDRKLFSFLLESFQCLFLFSILLPNHFPSYLLCYIFDAKSTREFQNRYVRNSARDIYYLITSCV